MNRQPGVAPYHDPQKSSCHSKVVQRIVIRLSHEERVVARQAMGRYFDPGCSRVAP
jgi:hypothetical protein